MLLTWPCFLTVALLVSNAAALPGTKWAPAAQRAKAQGRKALGASFDKRAMHQPRSECQMTNATQIKAPKSNIWADLSKTETASVVKWLFGQSDLNLTVTDEAGPWDNTLLLVELMQPNKTDALAYIDGSGKPPARYVHAVIDHQASDEPYYQDILVGPLPVSNGTTHWEPLEYPYTRKTEGRVRNLDADQLLLYTGWLYKITASVADITIDLWNATSMGLENDTIAPGGIDPLYQDDDRVMRWDGFFSLPTSIFDSSSMLPMGLYFLSDITGRDPSKWSLLGWYYNGIYYETTDDFRTAYFSGNFEKLDGNWDGAWAHTDQQGPVAPFDKKSPPVALAPQGSRYSVNSDSKYVEWMDWSFYVGFNFDTGMTLHDIKHKGHRVLYELGLQEALAHYAGSDPLQSHTAYLDSVAGFGPYAFELIKGYDCPLYATYLNSSFYVSETTHTHLDSMCLFEVDVDYPLSRHTAPNYVTTTKNVKFVIRSVYTIGNYDYMFSYSFFRDGSMAVDVRASGYIQAAFYAKNHDYGFHIHDQLSGSMHDHVLNFKADFDILGTDNSIELIHQVPTTTTYPWSRGKVFDTMKLERSFIETEDDGQFNWAPNSQSQVLIVNQDEPNKFGENRGYRLQSATGGAHLTMEKSSVLQNSAHWATHDLGVSRRKDTEPRSAHRFNNQDTKNPPVDYTKFFDGESLNQTDLVVWFNLGMHHVPHTGDLPNTVFTTAYSGVHFTPSNYFEIGVNVETVNVVRIDYDEDGATDVKHFGSFDQQCDLTYEPVFPDLMEYSGDIVVRKFPYTNT